jgi:hypothetical protein
MALMRVRIRRFLADEPAKIYYNINVIHTSLRSGTIAWVGAPEGDNHDVVVTIEEHDVVTRKGNDLWVTGKKTS